MAACYGSVNELSIGEVRSLSVVQIGKSSVRGSGIDPLGQQGNEPENFIQYFGPGRLEAGNENNLHGFGAG
jgi:hypothetical protein